ncbi:SICA antigen [Plasmodium coatneyi]|uniref:SICA antigen n=1 Tax=Plasmodium coatneyi TaxID=208452 RepID=A0A1B1DY70_9APIC|nr:SICA antigen [Plasmodium coatneyi]ANQ07733.1 SICA antigen [Plasmodium coatneyi]
MAPAGVVKSTGGEMITRGKFNFMSQLLPRWIRKYGIGSVDNIGDHVWKDIEGMFEELIRRLNDDSTEEKTLCVDIDKEDTTNTTIKKELCKALIRIIYFVSGIKAGSGIEKGWKGGKDKGADAYLRCVVGKVTTVKLFEDHCRINEVSKYVKQKVEEKLKEYGVQGRYEKCKLVESEGINVGKKFVGEQIDKWAEVIKSSTGKIPTIVEYNNCVNDNDVRKGKGAEKNRKREHFLELLGIKEEELTKLADTTGSLSKDQMNTVLQTLKDKLKKKKTPYQCSKKKDNGGFLEDEELNISDWFTAFSNNVTEEDEAQYNELQGLLALCQHDEDDEEIKKLNLNKYGKFCEIMVRNILLVTDVGKEYKSKQQSPSPCNKSVKGISVCDLLNVWAYYMEWFCAPRSVMEHAFKRVKEVRGEMPGDENYAECALDDVPNIPYGDGNNILPEVYYFFLTNMLYYKMAEATKEEWCADKDQRSYTKNVSEFVSPERADPVVADDGKLNKLKSLVEMVAEGMEQEKKEEEEVLKDLQRTVQDATAEQPPLPSSEEGDPGKETSNHKDEQVDQDLKTPKIVIPPKTKPGEDCNGKTSCEFVKCVAEEWRSIRNNQEWPKLWEDTTNMIQSLTNAISGKDTSDVSQYCTDNKEESKSLNAEEKAACESIARGLQYIYSIKLEEKQGNRVEHQRFKQTMSCVILNALIKKLKDEKKESCSVDKGISKAFESTNEIKKNKCKEGPCVPCTQEYDQNCNVAEGTVREKLEGIFNERNDQIQQVLNAICPDPPPLPQSTLRSEEDQELPSIPPLLPTESEGRPAGGREKASEAVLESSKAAALRNPIDPSDLTPYLPLPPVFLAISAMTYLLWKYFGMLSKRRKRYRRAHQVRGPSLEQQIVDHVDQPGPREYTIVKERKPRSVPKGKTKSQKKQDLCRRVDPRAGVRRRMIIDIHLEVLDECQKEDLHSTKEDFFEILVQEFMGSKYMEEGNVPKEQVPSLDSGLRVDVPKEQVPCSDSGF